MSKDSLAAAPGQLERDVLAILGTDIVAGPHASGGKPRAFLVAGATLIVAAAAFLLMRTPPDAVETDPPAIASAPSVRSAPGLAPPPSRQELATNLPVIAQRPAAGPPSRPARMRVSRQKAWGRARRAVEVPFKAPVRPAPTVIVPPAEQVAMVTPPPPPPSAPLPPPNRTAEAPPRTDLGKIDGLDAIRLLRRQ